MMKRNSWLGFFEDTLRCAPMLKKRATLESLASSETTEVLHSDPHADPAGTTVAKKSSFCLGDRRYRFAMLSALLLIFGFTGIPLAIAGAEKLKRKQAPHKDPRDTQVYTLSPEEEKQRGYMMEIARQIGVTCTYCHDVNNFKSEKIPAWKVAKRHIDFVRGVNQDPRKLLGPKMDCYMCHHGEPKPDFKEPLEPVD